MRLVSRFVATLVALVMAVTVAQGFMSPAQAAQPKHEGTVNAKEIGNSNKFLIFGKIKTAPGKKIKILRNAGGGKYSVFKTIKTKSNGSFRSPITQVGNKKTCFRVEVPGGGGYKKTTYQAPCIITY